LILYKAYEVRSRLDDPSRFITLLKEHAQDIEGYEEAFFSARDRLRKNGIAEWLALHHAYPWVNARWEKLKESFEFFVVSNKDSFSIGLILAHLNLPISEDHIFGKEFGMQKRRIIEAIMSEENIPKDKVYFIDDHHAHLMDVADLGIRLFFAGWGYGKFENSADNVIILLDKDNFDRQLTGGFHE
jgi:FMN phosphatase YigB (HAD superfamily)